MNGYVLDTHTMLWWVSNDRRIGRKAERAIESSRRVLVSDVTLWEIAIKSGAGRLSIQPDVGTWFEHHTVVNRFAPLPIRRPHLTRVATLARNHGDPFDRLLIAQALVEDLTIITGDRVFATYGVSVLEADA